MVACQNDSPVTSTLFDGSEDLPQPKSTSYPLASGTSMDCAAGHKFFAFPWTIEKSVSVVLCCFAKSFVRHSMHWAA